MAKIKRTVKAKEPVRLRLKKLANGNKSLYLDFYRDGERTYEFLKLYLVPELSHEAKVQNINTLNAANAIKAQRIIDIANGQAGLSKKPRYDNAFLLDYLDRFKENILKAGKSKSYAKTIDQLKRMLAEFGAEKTKLKNIDKNFCSTFLGYLRTYVTRYGRGMSNYTIYLYYQCFIIALNCAVDEGMIKKNPCHDVKDKPDDPETTRTYLTIDEVKNLINTNCLRQSVKSAFLFGCFCGLRYSDIVKLTWGDIYTEGNRIKAKVLMKKTGRYVDVYLSKAALKWMPTRGEKDNLDLVFDLPSHGRVSKIVKDWAKEAGITKYVTFHTSRHTFATMTLNDGKANIYVVSKMLGHKDIKTTQIYAEVLDREKANASDAVAAMFD